MPKFIRNWYHPCQANPDMETVSSRKALRLALFILVPAEYLSMFFSRLSPNIYGDVPLACAILIPIAAVVSLLSWKTHRVVAALGLLPSLLWFFAYTLPHT
jgi:hypothetical protein